MSEIEGFKPPDQTEQKSEAEQRITQNIEDASEVKKQEEYRGLIQAILGSEKTQGQYFYPMGVKKEGDERSGPYEPVVMLKHTDEVPDPQDSNKKCIEFTIVSPKGVVEWDAPADDKFVQALRSGKGVITPDNFEGGYRRDQQHGDQINIMMGMKREPRGPFDKEDYKYLAHPLRLTGSPYVRLLDGKPEDVASKIGGRIQESIKETELPHKEIVEANERQSDTARLLSQTVRGLPPRV